jgi:hypothetical protein
VVIPVSLRFVGAGVNVPAGPLRCLALAVLASFAAAACGGNANVSRADDQCSEQIILSLAPGFGRSDKLIEELSRDADVRLEYLRSISPNLFVFALTARARDPGCTNALARLRGDSRVRFAELDQRRTHFDSVQ